MTGSMVNQPIPVLCGNARILLLLWKVWMKIQISQFLVVHKNLGFLRLQLDKFCIDLDRFPYKIQLIQGLKLNDHLQRRQFADWALAQLEINPNFDKKIIFGDEVHFWLNGFVNKRNCRIWDPHNPQEIQQRSFTPKRAVFGVDFEAVASSNLISFKMRPKLH